MWPSGSTVRARTTTEEFATDSFQNLMYSICRFKEVTGNYPNKITTVSFSFKRRRFETLHAPALRWPPQSFFYIGAVRTFFVSILRPLFFSYFTQTLDLNRIHQRVLALTYSGQAKEKRKMPQPHLKRILMAVTLQYFNRNDKKETLFRELHPILFRALKCRRFLTIVGQNFSLVNCLGLRNNIKD